MKDEKRDEINGRKQALKTNLDGFIRDALTSKPKIDMLMAHYTMKGLYHYSFYNSMMIAMQGGTICNSYKRWQDAGRQVRKGEKASIVIFRPSGHKVKQTNENGEEEETWITSGDRFFLSSVFDVSQTDGKPLEYEHNTDGTSPITFDRAEQASEKLGFPVQLKYLGGGRGCTDGYKISINEASNDIDRVKTMFHELGHCLLKSTGEAGKAHNLKEVEAESVSYLCMSALGIKYELHADYVANYAQNHAGNINIDGILKAANKIIRLFE